ncbi:hypothetical protein NDU88_004336 [Pleurodeles waltl]|uniref:Uncharacterized protein n=1 Tax=Pleurodeles waltl TaxID=8319 RepID=A0AAV7M6V7_PLEWA|nr:hypothetical protein NDU88_004336 [Pleurodeles waltl]
MRSHDAAPAPTDYEDKLDKILEAIEPLNRVDAVAIEVTLLCEDQKKLYTRVTSVESDLRDMRPSLVNMEETIRRKGAHTPAQARLEQRQALSAAKALWYEDGQATPQFNNRRQTDSESEASVSETLSKVLPGVTPPDMLI